MPPIPIKAQLATIKDFIDNLNEDDYEVIRELYHDVMRYKSKLVKNRELHNRYRGPHPHKVSFSTNSLDNFCERLNAINFNEPSVTPIDKIVETLIGNKKFVDIFNKLHKESTNSGKSFKEYLEEYLKSESEENKKIIEILQTNNITPIYFLTYLFEPLCDKIDTTDLVKKHITKNGYHSKSWFPS